MCEFNQNSKKLINAELISRFSALGKKTRSLKSLFPSDEAQIFKYNAFKWIWQDQTKLTPNFPIIRFGQENVKSEVLDRLLSCSDKKILLTYIDWWWISRKSHRDNDQGDMIGDWPNAVVIIKLDVIRGVDVHTFTPTTTFDKGYYAWKTRQIQSRIARSRIKRCPNH